MSEASQKNEQKIKEMIKDDVLVRLFGDKIAAESSELPIRSSYVNEDLTQYNIVDAHYQFIKDEILHELAAYLLKEKQSTEASEVPIRASYINSDMTEAPILDAHYQKIKEDICQDIAKQLVKDKVVSEKDALKIHANYLQAAEKQSAKQIKEDIALRLQQKGMSLPDIAEVVGLSEDELGELCKK